jgi:hypothetical protein
MVRLTPMLQGTQPIVDALFYPVRHMKQYYGGARTFLVNAAAVEPVAREISPRDFLGWAVRVDWFGRLLPFLCTLVLWVDIAAQAKV